MKKRSMGLTAALLFFLSISLFAKGQGDKEIKHIKMATTTSTENSGLLAVLLPAFEKETGIRVDSIAVGTGKAIAHGENGDVDVILVHARSQEDAFVAAGYGVNRRDVMYNDFVIVGPKDDPAGISGMSDGAKALQKIASAKVKFLSRGDGSGTNTKEKQLWADDSITPSGSWYMETGQGMGAVLTMTNETQGYTLTDRGTWLAMKDKLDLKILVQGDPKLFNPYGVIAVNPKKYSYVDYKGAMKFIDFITSKKGQDIIAGYKVGGQQLFFPDAKN